jgi:hypothetical protein
MDPTIDLSSESKLHKRVLEALNKRFRLSAEKMWKLHDKWRKAEDSFVAYLPEKEIDAKKRVARETKGIQDYTTIVLPYSYSMLMSAHSYWTSVFLARSPILQYTARHGESMQATQAVEALMDYQLNMGKQILPFYFWLLDAGKFGLGVVGEYWAEEWSNVSRNQVVPKSFLGFQMGGTKSSIVTEKIRGYHGTKTFNIRPYDWFADPRVPLYDVQRMEFCGYHTECSWNDIVRKMESGEFVKANCQKLKAQASAGQGTGREQGSPRVELPNGDGNWSAADISDTGPYGLVTMHVDLIPREWGLGSSSTPEKWVFVASVKGRGFGQMQLGSLEYILGAKPLGSYHSKHPFNVIEMEPEAYAMVARGLPEIVEPLQRSIDWLVNSHMYNVRQAMNNQFLLDPSKIVMSDFNNPLAGGGIRLKQSAYGMSLDSIIKQLPVQDVTRNHLTDMQFLDMFAQKSLGINDQMMGMLNVGGRKTAAEIRTSSTFGVNRQKTNAEFFSTMGFGPHAELLLQESQQWYDFELKLKIVGDLVQDAGPRFTDVSPDSIQGFYDFVPVDGTLPVDRFAQANLWKEILVAIRQMPEIAGTYDVAKIFAWTAQLAGLKNITQMRVQSMSPEKIAAQVQQGNLIPMPTKGNLMEPKQISGMGPTA